jgi:spermidine/putrescine transport system ATP-binding protein
MQTPTRANKSRELTEQTYIEMGGGHMSKELIRLANCTMAFDDEVVLDNINLYINDKEFLTLLGPSGCGKTTTLRIIGGFQTPTSGDVYFDGVRINAVPPHKRAVNTVFQKYALFPHLNVYENIAFGLRIPKTDEQGKKIKLTEKEIDQRVLEMLDVVNLRGFEKRSVTSLSGGQQQRVAIARALVNRPKVLLLDEPLGALDMRLRKDMQNELKRIQQAMEITFIYVTHDQEEALAMSDTVVVMDGGKIQQIGTPEDIYNEPKNAFVADFIGESNIIDGIMRSDGVVEIFNRRFPCLDKGFDKDEPVDVVIRPEDVDIVPEDQGQLKGTVTNVTFKGMQYDIIVDFYGFKWLIQTTDLSPVGSRIGIKIDPDGIHVMKKSSYSGMFGDYSSYSEEYEEISDATYEPEEEGQEGEDEE